MKKTEGIKSRWTVPLRQHSYVTKYYIFLDVSSHVLYFLDALHHECIDGKLMGYESYSRQITNK